MASDDDLENELLSVEQQLSQVDRAIQKLLAKQQILQEQKEQIKLRIQQNSSAQLASLDWERSDYSWSSGLLEKLKNTFKISKLRPYQLSTMNAVMSKQDCVLIMPTGGGKSLCFQLPALLLPGITLVVSPLVSLMEDQLMSLQDLNVPVSMLNASSTRQDVNSVHNAMTDKQASLKLLYVTPEKLAKSKRFISKLEKMHKMGRFSLLAIDEVHCCSQWGHDFRPDYKFLGIMKRQFPNVPILGLTATATSRVVADVQKILNIPGCLVLKASFNRPNLKYEVCYKSSSQKENIDELENLLKTRFKKTSGIVYCFSIRECEEIASDLCKRNIRARSYHAQLDAKTRSAVHKSWASNEIQVVIATVAFGMGIDKPDVRFVIHHSMSKSMENFYQESGRAGRDDQLAHCILFYRFADMFRQSTMVFTEQTGLENLYAMVAYCLDLSRCRRSIIAQHFGERWEASDCKQMCDHCDTENGIVGEEKDATSQCLTLYKILEHCNAIDERLTAQKLIDAWLGKGPPKLRPAGHSPTSLSRETCERIIALLLLEGYLKEEFHFTPYSTISYLNIGPKAAAVKSNKHEVLLLLRSKKRKAQSLGSIHKNEAIGISPTTKRKKCDVEAKIKSKNESVKSTPTNKNEKKSATKQKVQFCVTNDKKLHFRNEPATLQTSNSSEKRDHCSQRVSVETFSEQSINMKKTSEVSNSDASSDTLDFGEWDSIGQKSKILGEEKDMAANAVITVSDSDD